jgi:5-methylcytosine-specific restriction endonuclease McrA
MSRSHVPIWLRRRLTNQTGDRCGYCLTPSTVTGTPLVVDHLIPEAFGGATEEVNLQARRAWVQAGWHPPKQEG